MRRRFLPFILATSMSLIFYAAAPAMSEGRSGGDGRQAEEAQDGSTEISLRVLPAPDGASPGKHTKQDNMTDPDIAPESDILINEGHSGSLTESDHAPFRRNHRHGNPGSGVERATPESGEAPREGPENATEPQGPPVPGRLPFTGVDARSLQAGVAGGLSAVILGALLIRLSIRRRRGGRAR